VGEFGEKFRKEREKKNFSLDDVASVTKIGTRMLRAIEEENFDRLPGGVFNKGFIRTYAKHLGMNDDKAVADYLARIRPPQADPQEARQPAPSTQNRGSSNRGSSPEKRAQSASKTNTLGPVTSKAQTSAREELPDLQLPRAEHVRRPKRKYLNDRDHGIPWGLVAAAALVLVLALFLWNRHSRNARAEASVVPKPAPAAQTTPAQSPVPAAYQTAGTRPTQPAATRSASVAQPSSAAPTAVVRSSSKPASAQTDGTAGADSPANSEQAPAPLTLIIRASENSWISVSADGEEVTAETLIAPAHTSVRAAREIVVRTGNAAGINFVWNGKEVPAQGAEAEVRTVVFDAAGVHVSTAAQPTLQNQ
jgi:cytoskeleton protein RodZ